MACATLKRSHNFDLLNSNPKRRRFHSPCSAKCISVDIIPPNDSPFAPSEHITQGQLKQRIREEIKRLQRRRLIPRFLGGPNCAPSSAFVPPEEKCCAGVTDGFRFMALRSPHVESQDSDSDHSPAQDDVALRKTSELSACHEADVAPECLPSSTNTSKVKPQTASSVNRAQSLDTVPIFTIPQVTALCDRLILEREEQLRQEYDNLLSCKLAEQYEAFLKFNHDQLYRRFQNTPMSYVS